MRETSRAVSPGNTTWPPAPTRTHGTSAGTGAPGAARTRIALEGSEHTRARQRDGVTGTLAIARGQADEGDRPPGELSVCIHLPTVRPGTRGRLPADVPLWTTPTRNATLCIEGSDGGPLWIIPTLE